MPLGDGESAGCFTFFIGDFADININDTSVLILYLHDLELPFNSSSI